MASPRKRRALKLARAKRLSETANPQPEPKVEETMPVAPPSEGLPTPKEEPKCAKCDKVLDSKESGCSRCDKEEEKPVKKRTRTRRKPSTENKE